MRPLPGFRGVDVGCKRENEEYNEEKELARAAVLKGGASRLV